MYAIVEADRVSCGQLLHQLRCTLKMRATSTGQRQHWSLARALSALKPHPGRFAGHISAFWRGNLINCAKIIPEAGIRLSCADAFKRRVYGSNDATISMFPRFVSGAFGGICGQVRSCCLGRS